MNRYWYRNVRWGVFSATLGGLLLVGGVGFYFFADSYGAVENVERIGVEEYTGEGREDVSVDEVSNDTTSFGEAFVNTPETLMEVEEVDGEGSEGELTPPLGGDSNYTGANFDSGLPAYSVYVGSDVMSAEYADVKSFYVNGLSVSENQGVAEFDETLLRIVKDEHVTEEGQTLVTYGTFDSSGGEQGMYILTEAPDISDSLESNGDDEVDLEVPSDEPEIPAGEWDNPEDDARAEEATEEANKDSGMEDNVDASRNSLTVYYWNDSTLVKITGITQSDTLPEWLTSLHLD